ncbi:L-seryl-tRNA(Sec) selenium transferase [Egicoccus halophilus]|uniref:L-seryl-tRNA(Sec) selenium transferase n=1 Tax=Egicoccus halophilus TaxID=1670830 RepID=A0A8J3A708_9ACTN|nr:L-seryl-tRNA(Sec) selenium transferase [Egicoccus halophilus]GGI02718.1 L-seryl-tRNA(Sec) selenium transferase [Egicoccus halophilus]
MAAHAGDPTLARLPQLDALLRADAAAEPLATHGRPAFTAAVRAELDAVRTRLRTHGGEVPAEADLLAAADEALHQRRAGRLTRVVNATGVVLHTNLGRAPLSAAARAAVTDATGYTTLEYDLDRGTRGSRTAHVGALAAELCATERATVVNNGAAALLLVLAALAGGRQVIVSRGELIEIGGSYRLPDVMAASGARMVEVGTTNRTWLADYRDAITDDTALLLKVHRSNYDVVGFTEEVGIAALADLGRRTGVAVVHDLGSGLIRTATDGPLASEPSVEASVRAGADLTIFSGDKLLGGPQAGLVVGAAALLRRCEQHPLARAVRLDKLQRAALEATLEAHLRDPLPADVPTVAMLHADPDALHERATAMAARLEDAEVLPSDGLVGGGSSPGTTLPSWAVALRTDTPDDLAARLRVGELPVVGRVEAGRVLLDLRTVPPSLDAEVVAAVVAARRA